MKATGISELEERKGAIRAYHKLLMFLTNDGAGKGKDVIEDAY